MATKSRLLFLLKYLHENTDDAHPVTGAYLRTVLADAGLPSPDMRTLRNDIDMLVNAGFDIVSEERVGVSTLYYYGQREWEVAELRILIDAVSSSQFVSEKKSTQIIRKLTKLGGEINAPYLKPGVFLSSKVKAKGNQLLYTVQMIEEGISLKRKITFQYYKYNVNKERVKRHGGEIYTVSPYATVWNADRYYLLCWSDKHDKVIAFRIDRMGIPTITEEKAVPAPAGFNPKAYSESVFKMYTGEDAVVTLRCASDTVDHIIDRFGTQVRIKNISDESFDAVVSVSVSPTFYAWVFQYMGAIRIVGPEHVKQGYLEMIKAARQ